jgi:hypothetical protein
MFKLSSDRNVSDTTWNVQTALTVAAIALNVYMEVLVALERVLE